MMKTLTGRVVSIKMPKTVVIEQVITRIHPKYKKILRSKRSLKAHCEIKVNQGDIVKFISCRPISKDKHYQVIKKINQKI